MVAQCSVHVKCLAQRGYWPVRALSCRVWLFSSQGRDLSFKHQRLRFAPHCAVRVAAITLYSCSLSSVSGGAASTLHLIWAW